MKQTIALVVVLFVCFLLSFASCGLSDTAHGLKLRIDFSFGDNSDQSNNGALLRIVLSNPKSNNQTITFLTWNTPFDYFMGASNFEVIDQETGESLSYMGAMVRRAFPSSIEELQKEFITLIPSEEISVQIDLSNSYSLVNGTKYSATLHTYLSYIVGRFNDIVELGLFSSEQIEDPLHHFSYSPLKSETVSIVASSELPVSSRIAPLNVYRSGYSDCDENQQRLVMNTLWPVARGYSSMAVRYLNMMRCDGSYVYWFGTYDSYRWNVVKYTFQRIDSFLGGTNYNILCETECAQSTWVAYVIKEDSTHTIHLCPYLWSRSLNFQASTLVHEISHFSDIGNTNDYVYGEANARNLAKTNPHLAVQCAENINFFAEKNPRC